MRRGWGLCFDSGCGWAWAWGRWNGEGEMGREERKKGVVGLEVGCPGWGAWVHGGSDVPPQLGGGSVRVSLTLASKPFFPSSGSNNRLLDAYVWPSISEILGRLESLWKW